MDPKPEVETQEPQNAEALSESAGLEAGFRKARGERAEPETEQPAKEAEQPQPEQPQTEAAEAEQPKPVEELPEWAKREFTRLNGELQKVYGKFGNVERRLQQPPPQAQAKPMAIKPEALKRVKENFGDEFAEAFAQDLNDVMGTAAEPPAQVPQPVQPVTNELSEASKAEQEETLTLLVPDWKELPNHPKFNEWVATKPPYYQEALGKSYNANAVAAGLNDFKAWLNAQQTRTQTNQQRLARAVQPKTSATSPRLVLPDEKGLEVGFAKARGRRPQL